MSVTAKELSAMLGLSEAAVSLALNNKPGVSTATRQRVIEAARQQGYDFARKASRLSTSRGELCLVIYKKSGAVVGDQTVIHEHQQPGAAARWGKDRHRAAAGQSGNQRRQKKKRRQIKDRLSQTLHFITSKQDMPVGRLTFRLKNRKIKIAT